MNQRTVKRVFSVFLAVLMLLSAMPMAGFVDGWKEITAKIAQKKTQKKVQVEALAAPDEATENIGELLRAEILVGDRRSVYETDENGIIRLVSEETLSSKKRGPSKAPQKPEEERGFDSENISASDAEAAARWALAHYVNEATTVLDANGTASVIYGTVGYDAAFADANHDLICDLCGYCIDGCSDGVEKYYTESDIAEGPDAEGKYYNAEGDLVGQDAVGTYTYELTDENDEPVLDDNGDPQTTNEEYSFIQFLSYTEGKDGVCDNCGKTLCVANDDVVGHDFTDGLCDGCGACLGAHTDAEIIDLADGTCDMCGLSVTHAHTDEDMDDVCDVCAQPVTHSHTDETGATETGNGRCDVCGYCMGDCVDANTDGACDVCGKPMLSACEHHDVLGNSACAVCGASACHLTTGRLQQIQGMLSLLRDVLVENDADEEHPQQYRSWLNDTLIPFLTAKTKDNDASATSLGSIVAMRQEIKSAVDENKKAAALWASISELTTADVTTLTLAGSFGVDGNGNRVLLTEGTWYGAVDERKADYTAKRDGCVFHREPR